ncbi:xyloglucan endo-1 family protein [Hibiscus syriacus]|uniref:1,3-beta-glucan synthase n=1 Tax=Hibiscus syriacus TaxID=106335 RepID=A0A6A2WJJ2_HIBSY|nr:xyloglucan endo-1 family protein [Hibiscus syriacus]
MSALRQRPVPTRAAASAVYARSLQHIPVHDLLDDHPSLLYPEVCAVAAALLRPILNLPKPPFVTLAPNMDLMGWLGVSFGFQNDNVRNQREKLVLLLANCQMRLQRTPTNSTAASSKVSARSYSITTLRGALFFASNPTSTPARRVNNYDPTRELLYVSLYLLNWGEAANLRFCPELLCYIYHHMAMELTKFFDQHIDEFTGRPFVPSISGDCAFLKCIVMPFYQTIKTEVESSRNGTALHSAWRNYDDINEYLWSRRCFKTLKWPINSGCNFFDTVPKFERVGKTGEEVSLGSFGGKGYSGRAVNVFYARIWSQKNGDRWWSPAANQRIVTFLEAIFVYVIPELLSLLFFVIPWVRNWIEGLDWMIISWLTWWFHSRIFVGRGLREDKAPGCSNKGSFESFKYLQIWYSVFSSFVGATNGLFSHLGEIRNMEQLRLRFQFFASAMQFNLMPEDQLLTPKATLVKKLREAIHRLQLRYGLGQPYKMESSQVEARRFTMIWNEIITTLREEALISDREVELMELPPNCWNIRANELADAPDMWLWVKILKNEYGRCSVIEAYDKVKHNGKLTATFKMTVLQKIHAKITKKSIHKLMEEGLAPKNKTADEGLLFENAINIPGAEDRRRIAFFSNSIFMIMPRAPNVEKMMAFSVLTPYYDEDVLYKKEMLQDENEDGISTLCYLQKIYEDDWRNFMEQMRREGMDDDDDIWREKLRDLRLWASYRGQTLSHTVRGMMYYYRALKTLCYVDSASEMDIRMGTQEIASHHSLNRNRGAIDGTNPPTAKTEVAKGGSHAEEILFLMKNNEALRVAYVDEVEYYSVLVKYDQKLQRGDAVQTIDMNQDNYFEETQKMRNLLEEFKMNHGIRKPTILGARENVFTGSVSSLTLFMSAEETSFVTLGQRVLANPLKVGKGRDVGLNQISMFEAKVASGNGEQVLSRDVYRLGHRLDFFRMLSFYYSFVRHYFNTMMVVLTVYTFLWGRLYISLIGVERHAKNQSISNEALGTILNQQFIIQLASFIFFHLLYGNTDPFLWTILHGGAKYRATGRGFVVEHKSCVENYRLYARSHFVKAIELGVILAVYASYNPLAKDSFVNIAMTISSWFLVVSWMMSPFVLNPSGFDWLKTVNDFDDFMNWVCCRVGALAEANKIWEWWYEEQDHLRTTGLWGKLLEIILDLRFFFFQYGIVYQLSIANHRTSVGVYLLSWMYMIVAVGIYVIIVYAQDKYAAKQHIYYRVVQLVVVILVILVIVLLLEFTSFKFIDLVTSLIAFIPTGWGMISIAQVVRPFLQSTVAWRL